MLRPAPLRLLLLAAAILATGGCDTHDCSSVAPGRRSVAGPTAFRFDTETVEIDLSTTPEYADLSDRPTPPISASRLQLFWSAAVGTDPRPARMVLDIAGVDDEGTFALADLGATVCGCPPGSTGVELGPEPRCTITDSAGTEHTVAATCEAVVGELVVRELGEACSEERARLCAPQQSFDLRIPERDEARFSAEITVRWFDVIDEQTCTGSPIGPVA